MASSKRERERRQERAERREARQTYFKTSETWKGPPPKTVKEAARQEQRQQVAEVRKAVAFQRVPDYVGQVTRHMVDAPLPASHPKAVAFTPSPVTTKKSPDKKQRPEKNSSFRTEPVVGPSHLAREEKLKNCKRRPEKLEPRRAGGGASKKFVPWCK